MENIELEIFKKKHGGYNPYELEIHKRGFNMGFLLALLYLVGFTLIGLIAYMAGRGII